MVDITKPAVYYAAMTTAIERACEIVGGQAEIARICDVTDQAVYKWVKKGFPPAERCISIEEATNSKVTRYELRPDVFGSEPPKQQVA